MRMEIKCCLICGGVEWHALGCQLRAFLRYVEEDPEVRKKCKAEADAAFLKDCGVEPPSK